MSVIYQRGIQIACYLSIILYRDPRFTSQIWKGFQKVMGTQLSISTVFHSQIDGQLERVVQILEDNIQARVLNFKGNWTDHLPLIKFSYNSSYQSSIGVLRLYMVNRVDPHYVGPRAEKRSIVLS